MTPESRALGDGCYVVHDQQHIILRTINGEGMVSNVIYLNKSVFLELVDHGITAFPLSARRTQPHQKSQGGEMSDFEGFGILWAVSLWFAFEIGYRYGRRAVNRKVNESLDQLLRDVKANREDEW